MPPADEAVARVAERMGRADTFRLTPVGVHFGAGPGAETADPYFGGAGPRRVGCTQCGSCMTGCRTGAKNMLTENYLYLAERAGAQVIAMTTVTAVRPAGSGYRVDTVATGPLGRGRRRPGRRRGRCTRWRRSSPARSGSWAGARSSCSATGGSSSPTAWASTTSACSTPPRAG